MLGWERPQKVLAESSLIGWKANLSGNSLIQMLQQPVIGAKQGPIGGTKQQLLCGRMLLDD
jgi:hypothetical protein